MRRPPTSVLPTVSGLLSAPEKTVEAFAGPHRRLWLTHSGRSALYVYASTLRRSGRLSTSRNVILAPAFHCPTVIDPLLHAGYEIRYYPVDETLRARSEEFLAALDERVAVALFIRYFGLTPAESALHKAVRQSGGRVLEDCSHSYLDGEPVGLCSSGADATTYSFYKTAPIACGGGLLLDSQDSNLEIELLPSPMREELRITADMISRTIVTQLDAFKRHIENGHDDTEAAADLQPVVLRSAADAYPYDTTQAELRMPWLSRQLLNRVDVEVLAAARRRNFMALLRAFPASKHVRPMFSGEVGTRVPWGFPVVSEQRANIDYRIRAAGVPVFSFGETLHPHMIANAPGRTRDEAICLSRSVFAIAIHQDITAASATEFGSMIGRALEKL